MSRKWVKYYEATEFKDAWEAVILPWLDARSPSLSAAHADVIIVPHASTINFIKNHLANNNLSVVGLCFWTPSLLRKALCQSFSIHPTIALREDLHLLLSIIASKNNKDSILQAIVAEPESFLQAFDALIQSRWGADAFPYASTRSLASLLIKALNDCQLTTIQQIDGMLFNNCHEQDPVLGNVLLWGFHSHNWEKNLLLQAATKASHSSILCFLSEAGMTTLEQAWQGSWELLAFTVEKVLENPDHKPFYRLAESFAFPDLITDYSPQSSLPSYLFSTTILQESKAIVTEILKALEGGGCTRIGVIFSNQSSSLAREVSAQLNCLKVAHFDGIGHNAAKPLERNLFEAWIGLQKNKKLDTYLRFLTLLAEQGVITPKILKAHTKTCLNAFQDTMNDSLEVIFAYLSHNSPSAETKSILEQWDLLPSALSFSEFFTQILSILKCINWPKELDFLQKRARIFSETLIEPIALDTLLQWLDAITNESGRLRYRSGSEPFARVHLLTGEEAISQQWSHLIITEFNQGSWPARSQPNPFLNDEQIEALNQRVLITGPQGQGHLIVKRGFSLITSSGNRHIQSKAILQRLIGLPIRGLTFTAHLQDPLDNNKRANLSEFLEILYWLSEGELLAESFIPMLLAQTQQLVKQYFTPCNRQTDSLEFESILRAYTSRRNAQTAFNEYSFSMKTPPPESINLSCKAWEDAIQTPTRCFFKNILGIEKLYCTATQNMQSLTLGTWVHNWIQFKKKLSFEKIDKKAFLVRAKMEKVYATLDKKLPSWWLSYWHEARRTAHGLCKSLGECCGYPHFHSEYRLPSPSKIKLPGIIEISLSGRIDLLLSDGPLDAPTTNLWIIDFKTGSKGALSPKKMPEAHGLQLVLYALAFYQNGVKNISLSILQPDSLLKEQLKIQDILEHKSLLNAINIIHKQGNFGQRGPIPSQYHLSYEDYPISTLPIPKETLKSKWNLTHPDIPF